MTKTALYFIRLVLLLMLSCQTSYLIVAQETSRLPDGKTLPRADYLHVRSSIPEKKTSPLNTQYLALPCYSDDDQIIRHTAYTISYSGQHRQPYWVAYELTEAMTRSIVKRSDKFIPDPQVDEYPSTNEDYRKSGYDRGHLVPAGDMGYSETTMRESFFLSNMSPQVPAFNRGIWKKLETLVRSWVSEDSVLFISAGGMLDQSAGTIGKNRVTVPERYFKVVLTIKDQKPKGIGFILPNAGSSALLQTFAVTIDSVEKVTGFDFFCRLPDRMETEAEAKLDTNYWFFRKFSEGNLPEGEQD